MTNIGVGRGKLYLWCRRGRVFPGHRLPGRLHRLLTLQFHHNHVRRSVLARAHFPRLKAGPGMIDGPGLVPRRGMKHLPVLIPRLGMNHLPRLNPRLAAQRQRRRLGIGGANGADHVLDLNQARSRDQQRDARRRDAHARHRAKRARPQATPCRNRAKHCEMREKSSETNRTPARAVADEPVRLCRMW